MALLSVHTIREGHHYSRRSWRGEDHRGVADHCKVNKRRKESGRNPKRIKREVRKQIQNTGIGTKSQQEQLKTERKTVSREQREAQKQRQFELKQQKRKEKHRGR